MAKTKKTTKKSIDWSDKEHIEILIQQCKFMWNEDYVALLANLIGLKPGAFKLTMAWKLNVNPFAKSLNLY